MSNQIVDSKKLDNLLYYYITDSWARKELGQSIMEKAGKFDDIVFDKKITLTSKDSKQNYKPYNICKYKDFLYIVTEDKIVKMNKKTFKEIGHIDIPHRPLCVCADDKYIYVGTQNGVYKLSNKNLTILDDMFISTYCPRKFNSITVYKNHIYTIETDTSMLIRIDKEFRKIKQVFLKKNMREVNFGSLDYIDPNINIKLAVCICSDDDYLYISNLYDSNIHKLEVKNSNYGYLFLYLKKSTKTGIFDNPISMDADNSNIYVLDVNSNRVGILSKGSLNLMNSIKLEQKYEYFNKLCVDNENVFITDARDNSIVKYKKIFTYAKNEKQKLEAFYKALKKHRDNNSFKFDNKKLHKLPKKYIDN